MLPVIMDNEEFVIRVPLHPSHTIFRACDSFSCDQYVRDYANLVECDGINLYLTGKVHSFSIISLPNNGSVTACIVIFNY